MASSFSCPICGSHENGVVDSRVASKDLWRRRRKCAGCGEKWNTLEIKEDELRQVFALMVKIEAAVRALDDLEAEDIQHWRNRFSLKHLSSKDIKKIQRRAEAGLTVTEIAGELGIHYGTVRKYLGVVNGQS